MLRRHDRAMGFRRHRRVGRTSEPPRRLAQILIRDGLLALAGVLLGLFADHALLQPPDQGVLALLAPVVALVVVVSLLVDGSLGRP